MPSIIELNKKQVIKLYNECRSLRKVAKILETSITPIRRILYSNQIEMNTSRIYEIDETYFETINTEHKAYWLGFLYADGCVRIRKDTSHSLSFKQHKRDKDIFIKFNECLNSNYPFKPVKNTNVYQIEIGSKKLVKALISKGCMPRKSLILSFPEDTILPVNLQKHFIRGYFDGDGSISIVYQKRSKYPAPILNIAGTKSVMSFIKEILVREGMEGCQITPYMNKKAKNKLWYVILTRKKNILSFYHYIYRDASIFMERKNKKFNYLIDNKYLEYYWGTAQRNRDKRGRYI
ncbi:hypothetical protein LCGC14_0797420 [marine sediment metagenome]|uniref:DOD-type homing endonuclease domain-containing protein n=1 Tax=marine sediment metagenome TaxID=412755 RepID=A0A0F9SAP3_9ZZZZ